MLSRPISWHLLATYRAGFANSLLFCPISWHLLATYGAGIADSLLFRPITYSNHSNNRAGIASCAIPALYYFLLPLPEDSVLLLHWLTGGVSLDHIRVGDVGLYIHIGSLDNLYCSLRSFCAEVVHININNRKLWS